MYASPEYANILDYSRNIPFKSEEARTGWLKRALVEKHTCYNGLNTFLYEALNNNLSVIPAEHYTAEALQITDDAGRGLLWYANGQISAIPPNLLTAEVLLAKSNGAPNLHCIAMYPETLAHIPVTTELAARYQEIKECLKSRGKLDPEATQWLTQIAQKHLESPAHTAHR